MHQQDTTNCGHCGSKLPSESIYHIICDCCSQRLSRDQGAAKPPVLARLMEGAYLIPLTMGQVAIIDECDLDIVTPFQWRAVPRRIGKFAARGTVRGEQMFMHRYLLGSSTMMVDHVNGNSLDNRRANLREATYSQNNANRDGWSGKLLPKGVHQARSGKYVAQIGSAGRNIHLGTFDTPEEAAMAYIEAAKTAYGEFFYPSH